MATLWGIPASLLVNTIVKGVFAGTSRVSVSKAMPWARQLEGHRLPRRLAGPGLRRSSRVRESAWPVA